jgi:hypothetical protein
VFWFPSRQCFLQVSIFLAVVELVVEPAETLPRHHWSKAKFVVKFNQVGDGVFFWQWFW